MNTQRKTITDAANIVKMKNYANNIDKVVNSTKKDIVNTAKQYQNNSLASQTGFVAEEVHIGSFNIDSALKRSSLKAVKEKNGFHGDYKILDGEKVVSKGEFKHYSTAKKTENAMRGYDDRDLIGPSDQVEDIQKIAKQRAMKNKITRPRVSKEHARVAKKVSDRIEKDGVKSKPKTLRQQRKLTKNGTKGKVVTKELLPDFKESMRSSVYGGALEGAKNGAVFGGGMSAVSNIVDVVNGKKTKTEALKDVTIDTAKSVADSAVKNAVGSATKVASIHLAEKVGNEVAKKALGSAAPIIVATTLVETGKDLYLYANGEIDGEEVIKNTGRNVTTAGGAWAGAEAGASIGTLVGGPVGTIVGGIFGGVIGALGVSALFD